jgi:hypothetical protein
MLDLQTNINIWLAESVKRLQENYLATGRKASGTWGKTLETFYEPVSDSIRFGIKAEHYTEYLINGREKTINKGETPLIEIISQWCKDKGLQPKEGQTFDKMVSAITWHIHHYGIKVPNTYNQGDLLSNVFTDEWMQELQKYLSGSLRKVLDTTTTIYTKTKA